MPSGGPRTRSPSFARYAQEEVLTVQEYIRRLEQVFRALDEPLGPDPLT